MKLAFIDFWPNFEEDNNYWYHLLDSAYDVEIDPNNRNGKATPDLMFLHTDSYRFLDRKNYVDTTATRVFWTMEGVPPNFDADTYPPYPSIRTIGGVGYNDPNSSLTKLSNDFDRSYYYGRCDFALTHEIMSDSRHYRFPYWVYHIDWFNKGNYGGEPNYLVPENEISNNIYYNTPKTKFCAIFMSNPTCQRLEAYNKLSAYKQVDGYGNSFMRDIVGRNEFHGVNGPWEKRKLEVLKDYRFSICFEHQVRDGYHSEKLFHAKVAGTIPIYWGASTVSEDFNPDCFINLNDFDSVDAMVERIKEIDQNETLYKQYAEAPLFVGNAVPDKFKPAAILDFFQNTVLS